MKKALTVIILIASVVFAISAEADVFLAEVTQVKPIEVDRTEMLYRRDCYNVETPITNYEPVYGYERNTAAPVIGAIVGGLVGHQFGGGSGKDALTVVGALVGAHSQRDRMRQVVVGHSPVTHTQTRTECREIPVPTTRTYITGYEVWYSYEGTTRRVILQEHPGAHVRVETSITVY